MLWRRGEGGMRGGFGRAVVVCGEDGGGAGSEGSRWIAGGFFSGCSFQFRVIGGISFFIISKI